MFLFFAAWVLGTHTFAQFVKGNIWGEREVINDMVVYQGDFYFSVYYNNNADFFSSVYKIDTAGNYIDSLVLQGVLASGFFITHDSLYLYGVGNTGIVVENISDFHNPQVKWQYDLTYDNMFMFSENADSVIFLYGYKMSPLQSFIFKLNAANILPLDTVFIDTLFIQKGTVFNHCFYAPLNNRKVYKYDFNLNKVAEYYTPVGENHIYLKSYNNRFYHETVYTEGGFPKIPILVKTDTVFSLLKADTIASSDTANFPGVFNAVQISDGKIFTINTINVDYYNYMESNLDNYISLQSFDTNLTILCNKHLHIPGRYLTAQNFKIFGNYIYVLATVYNYLDAQPDLGFVIWKLDKNCHVLWSHYIPDNKGFAIYPVPFSKTLNVKVESEEQYTFELYNFLGQKIKMEVLHKGQNTYDFSNLHSGYYFYRITNVNGQVIKNGKIIKD